MRLEGTLYSESRLVSRLTRDIEDDGRPFVYNLDRCLLALCKDLGIPLPVWMAKNTREFAAWRQTEFTQEQFGEKIFFDRFAIRLSESF